MERDVQSTYFFNPQLKSPEEVKKAFLAISAHQLLTQLLDAMPVMCLLLNDERQIVFANKATLDSMHLKDAYALCGQRPGKALQCVFASEGDNDCGAARYCPICGPARRFRNDCSADDDAHECRILRRNGLEALDLRVSLTPITVGEDPFVLFLMVDIRKERKSTPESMLLHDFPNPAGVVREFGNLFPDREGDNEKYPDTIPRLSTRLAEEIEKQGGLSGTGDDELQVKPAIIDAENLLEQIKQQYEGQPIAKGRQILIAPQTEQVILQSNRVLLKRVLANLVKSALEASRQNAVVLMGADARHGTVEFWVRTSQPTNPYAQSHPFQRSFSTTGQDGAGLGDFTLFRITLPSDSLS